MNEGRSAIRTDKRDGSDGDGDDDAPATIGTTEASQPSSETN